MRASPSISAERKVGHAGREQDDSGNRQRRDGFEFGLRRIFLGREQVLRNHDAGNEGRGPRCGQQPIANSHLISPRSIA